MVECWTSLFQVCTRRPPKVKPYTWYIFCAYENKCELYFKHVWIVYEYSHMHNHVTYFSHQDCRIETGEYSCAVQLKPEQQFRLETKKTWIEMYFIFRVRCVTRYDVRMRDVPGTPGVKLDNRNRYPRYCDKGIPVPRVLCHSLTKLTDVPGTVM